MRTLRSGCILFLLTGLFAFTLASVANAADVNSQPKYYSQEQTEFHNALRQLSDEFQAEYPEYLDFSNNREVMDRRAELARIWTERVQALRADYDGALSAAVDQVADEAWHKTPAAPADQVRANPPNELADLGGPEEANNASFSFHEGILAEAYGVWTKHFGPFGLPPTQVWFGGTPAAGSDGPWVATGGINAVVPLLVLPESWNPSMAAVPPIAPPFDAYYMAMSEWAAPALVTGAPSAIVANASVGSSAPFPSGTGPAGIIQGGPTNWVDYPYLVVDDVPGNAGPPGFGDVHIAWVEYIEGGDADANGNGIFYDDAADAFNIWVASANTAAGPSPYPNFFLNLVHVRPAVMPLGHQSHRPSLSVVGPTGTPPPVGLPPSAVYIAYVDFLASGVIIDASPAPGAGAPWGVFGPFLATPIVLLPPVLNGGVKAASTVSIAVDNGPLFTGQVYLAWADHSLGDADIFFSFSGDGGATWAPPFRVNQDAPGNGADQWAPHMVVDPLRGTICITYYDRRSDPTNVAIETWSSTSTNGGFGWADSLVSDPGPTPPVTALNVGGLRYVGDYLTSDFNPVSGWAAIWNDGRNGGDQDVYFENLKQAVGLDSDGDGIPDATDNCPAVFNPIQAITIALTGDVLPPSDGLLTAADIIYLVNYVFKSGPMPNPCQAAGDVTCDGAITAADVIYLVNHVFKGGPAPCNVCLAFGLGWTCP